MLRHHTRNVGSNKNRMNKSTVKKASLWFDIGIGILFSGFTIFIFIMVYINENPNKNFGYLFVAIFGFYSYLNLTTSLYRKKYQKISDGITAEINNGKLIVKNNITGITKIIENKNVKKIELYYSWNTNSFSSDLGYSKIILNDNSTVFLISNTINQNEIRKTFKTKLSNEKNRFMNKLK
jgi:hypothetical protein